MKTVDKMFNTKALNPPCNDELVSLEEHVNNTEVYKQKCSIITFDYQLDDKTTKSKLLKAAKRPPLDVENNSTSANLIFSAGAWYHIVLPSIKYFEEVNKEDKGCKIIDYTIKVSGVKMGKEGNGKHVNTQIIFYANRDKIVCHLYNTTQLILINGNGYQKFIDLFLKPFFESMIDKSLDEIETMNDEVATKLGQKTVKRSTIKLRRGIHNCHSCDFAAKTSAALKRHRTTEHPQNAHSLKLVEPRQSTRNNSVIVEANSVSTNHPVTDNLLMLENITIADMTKEEENILEENSLKYTCDNCNFVTVSKKNIDEHIKTKHIPEVDEEIRFECAKCKQELTEAKEYDDHMKTHDKAENNCNNLMKELENKILCQIIECSESDYTTKRIGNLNTHMIARHDLNEQIVTSMQTEQTTQTVVIKSKGTTRITCNFCDYVAESIDKLWNHNLEEHIGQPVDHNNMEKNDNKRILEEVLNMKSTVKDILEQVINEFEDGMNILRDQTNKHTKQTNATLISLQNKIETLSKSMKTPTKSSSSTIISPPESTTSVFQPRTMHGNVQESSKPRKANNTQISRPTTYQKRPRVLMVGEYVAHNMDFRTIEQVTNTTIKTVKTNKRDRKTSVDHHDVADVVKTEITNAEYEHLVLVAPTEVITGLDTLSAKPDDSTEIFKRKVEKSCRDVVNIAENAINSKKVKSVTIVNHPSRSDTHNTDPFSVKQKLANFANSFFLELWFDSPHKDKIMIGSHTLDCSYTENVVNILLNSFQATTNPVSRHQVDDHSKCPQAQYQLKQKRLYSSVVAGNGPIKTFNRFSPLKSLGN